MFVRGRVHAAYHQFHLTDPNAPALGHFGLPTNGIALALPGTVVIFTGIHTGPVALSVALYPVPPRTVDVDHTNWDEVVEISMRSLEGSVRVVGGPTSGAAMEFPVLTPDGAGDYRMRIHARGRDTDVDGVAVEPFECYLIQVWPQRFVPEKVFKSTDEYGHGIRHAALTAPPVESTSPPDSGLDPRRAEQEANLQGRLGRTPWEG